MPHPWLCLDAIEAAVKGAEEGLKVERVSFDKAVSSTACKGLRTVLAADGERPGVRRWPRRGR